MQEKPTVRMKKMIKRGLGHLFAVSEQMLWKNIMQAQVISFDIFDTLVKRNVWEPEDIHKLVQQKFYRQTGTELSGYVELRLRAEKLARKEADEEEISLEDIFCHISGIPEEQKHILKELEKEAELENCSTNIGMKKIYDKAVQSHKHIIITSDMYLGQEVIEKILAKCGYAGYEKLYLSSVYKKCKATGNLFKVIQGDYADHKGKILHIGDNIKGDYMAPRRKGINALLVKGNSKNLRYWRKRTSEISDFLLYKRITAFLNNHIDEQSSWEERVGYEVIGPVLYGYCTWLHECLNRDGIEKIFFLSREGELLQKAYRILFPDDTIPNEYLYVSRQALTVPLLSHAENLDDIAHILRCFLKFPHLQALRVICDIEPTYFQKKLKEIDLDENVKLHEIQETKKQYVFDIIMQAKKTEFAKQRLLIEKYLEENKFQGKIAISDVGWVGTMQEALQQYTAGKDIKIKGYYLGYRNLSSEENFVSIHRAGYLFSPRENREIDLAVRFTSNILEFLFMNCDGSVQKYKKRQNIEPVFHVKEYGDWENTFIATVQKNALDFLKQAKRELDIKEIPPDIVFIPYKNWAVKPSMETVHIYEKVRFLNGVTKSILPSHSIFYYMIHPRQFVDEMNESGCKIFFLKKIFKLNLPYFTILKLILKLGIQSEYQKNYVSRSKSRP